MKIKPRNIIFNILAIITVLAAVFVCFNIFSGAKGYSVITDSMSPSINKGDVVFVKKADFSSLNEGDVVTVRFADATRTKAKTLSPRRQSRLSASCGTVFRCSAMLQ